MILQKGMVFEYEDGGKFTIESIQVKVDGAFKGAKVGLWVRPEGKSRLFLEDGDQFDRELRLGWLRLVEPPPATTERQESED